MKKYFMVNMDRFSTYSSCCKGVYMCVFASVCVFCLMDSLEFDSVCVCVYLCKVVGMCIFHNIKNS